MIDDWMWRGKERTRGMYVDWRKAHNNSLLTFITQGNGWMYRQWQIQDFPGGGANPKHVGVKTYYFCQFVLKTA